MQCQVKCMLCHYCCLLLVACNTIVLFRVFLFDCNLIIKLVFYFLILFVFVVLVPVTPLSHTPASNSPTHQRKPSLKNSNQIPSPASPPLPSKGIMEEQSESAHVSPVKGQSDAVGEELEGVLKPKRTAPPPPPTGKTV